jgi:hypothetical protein
MTTRVSFHETFLVGLVGYTNDRRTILAVGGAGTTLGAPQYEGRTRDAGASDHWVVLTGGFNVIAPFSARDGVVIARLKCKHYRRNKTTGF